MAKSKKPTLATFSREFHTSADRPEMLLELFQGSDRAAALVAAAVVESVLIMAIGSRFVATDGDILDYYFYSNEAPLSDFNSRIKIGRGIGIYGQKIERMLHSIRKVRNAFAHAPRPLKFTEDVVAVECEKLPDTRLGKHYRDPPKGLSLYRDRYLAVCLNLEVILRDYALRHQGKPITIDIPDDEPGGLPMPPPLPHKS